MVDVKESLKYVEAVSTRDISEPHLDSVIEATSGAMPSTHPEVNRQLHEAAQHAPAGDEIEDRSDGIQLVTTPEVLKTQLRSTIEAGGRTTSPIPSEVPAEPDAVLLLDLLGPELGSSFSTSDAALAPVELRVTAEQWAAFPSLIE
jgi:hypothetical protein